MNIHPAVRRHVRRAVTLSMVIAVLVAMAIGAVLDWWTAVTRPLIKWLGLTRFEAWLRRTPWWVGLILLPPMGFVYFAFWAFKLHLMFVLGHFILAEVLTRIFDIVYVSLLHYVWHIYFEKFLVFKFIARLHNRYLALKEQAFELIRAQPWYWRAVRIRRRLRAYWRRRRTRYKVAKRWWLWPRAAK